MEVPDELLALAGPDAQVVPGAQGIYVFGQDASVTILTETTAQTALLGPDRITLRGPFPPRFDQAIKSRSRIDLFVRHTDGCLPLATRAFVSAFGRNADSDAITECDLIIEPLPFQTLDLVRPPDLTPPPDLGWLDHLPHDPIAALEGFVDGWFCDIPPSAPYPEADQAVPQPLRAFYRIAAGRPEVLGNFNTIYPPTKIRRRADGQITFGAECQGVWRLLMDPTTDDPVVHYAYGWTDTPADEIVIEREHLRGFLLGFVLTDATLVSDHGAWGFADADQVRRFIASLRPVPLQPMRYPTDRSSLFVAPGVVALVCEEKDSFQIYVGAHRSGALVPFREPGFVWENLLA